MSNLSKVLFVVQVDLFNKLGITRISGNLTITIDLLKASCQFFGVGCMFCLRILVGISPGIVDMFVGKSLIAFFTHLH